MDIGDHDSTIHPTLELDEDFTFVEILPKLPAKSLMRFKCVSKSWLDRISGDSSFIKAHQNLHPNVRRAIVLERYDTSIEISDDRQRMTLHCDQGMKMTEVDVSYIIAKHGPIEIVGSCNGLVCLLSVLPGVSQLPNSLILWNPVTRQARKLPNAPKGSTRSFGFGFDGSSGDYKVICLTASSLEDRPFLYAQVLVKNGTIWRRPKRNHCVWGRPEMLPSTGTVEANGALHWAAYMSNREKKFVVSFDLSDEGLQVAHGPGGNKWHLCNWRESLAAIAPCAVGGGYDMWVAGKDLSWNLLFRMSEPSKCSIRILSGRFQLAKNTLTSFGLGMLLHLKDPKVGGYCRLSCSDNYIETIISVF